MAAITHPVASAQNNTAVLSLVWDDVSGLVTGIVFVNTSGRDALIEVTKPGDTILSTVRGQGTFTTNVPQNRRFPFADPVLTDWRVAVSLAP